MARSRFRSISGDGSGSTRTPTSTGRLGRKGRSTDRNDGPSTWNRSRPRRQTEQGVEVSPEDQRGIFGAGSQRIDDLLLFLVNALLPSARKKRRVGPNGSAAAGTDRATRRPPVCQSGVIASSVGARVSTWIRQTSADMRTSRVSGSKMRNEKGTCGKQGETRDGAGSQGQSKRLEVRAWPHTQTARRSARRTRPPDSQRHFTTSPTRSCPRQLCIADRQRPLNQLRDGACRTTAAPAPTAE